MKTTSKHISELLAAYIDGGLTEEEQKFIEEELSKHPEYEEEIKRLRQVRSLVSKKKQLDPSPYFWNQLEARISASERRSFLEELLPLPKRLIPVAAAFIVVAVIVLAAMFTRDKLFRQYVGGKVEEAKDIYENSFLSGNFATLLSKITKDDVFQFALSGILPVSTANAQVLHFGDQPSQGYWVEVGYKPPVEKPQHSRNAFYNEVRLKPNQAAVVDSLLDDYKDKLQKSVLVSGDRFIAINSDVWNMNKTLMFNIARNLDEQQRRRMTVVLGDANPLKMDFSAIDFSASDSILRRSRFYAPRRSKEFVIISPDTICVKSFSLDPDSFVVHVSRLDDGYYQNLWSLQDSVWRKQWKWQDSLRRAHTKRLQLYQDSVQRHVKIVLDSIRRHQEYHWSRQDSILKKQWRWQDSLQRAQMKILRVYQDSMQRHMKMMLDDLRHREFPLDSRMVRVYPDSLRCRIEIGREYLPRSFDSIMIYIAPPKMMVRPQRIRTFPRPRVRTNSVSVFPIPCSSSSSALQIPWA